MSRRRRRTWSLRDEYLQGGSIDTRQECWEKECRRRKKEWEELYKQTEAFKKEDDFCVLQYQLEEVKRHYYGATREILSARMDVLAEQGKERMKPSIQANTKADAAANKEMKDVELEYLKDEELIKQLMAQFRSRHQAENH
jgi:hypothetical protein